LVISHAACAGHAPENTLAGIRAALGLGVDAIEIDVHASADRTPVVIHDPTVDRTTDGTGAITETPLRELRALDAGITGFDGRFAGERIPTLTEVIELIAGRCLLVIEIKQPGIAALVVEAVRDAGALRSSMVWSFNLNTVTEVRRVEPLLPAALLTPVLAANIPDRYDDALASGLTGVSLHHQSVDRDAVHAGRLRGLSIYTWTADDPQEQRRLLKSGVDGIVTNKPDVLLGTLA
jgi:glycerophosphoryl diester phosphodiesterase